MSVVSVRAALETALMTITPAIATAFENVAFVPPAASVPYQKAFVLFAEPENNETGNSYFEQGYLQVTLCYPRQTGTAAAGARAQLIRAKFRKGASFTSSGIVVQVTKIPQILTQTNEGAAQGSDDGTMYTMTVKVRFHAFIN